MPTIKLNELGRGGLVADVPGYEHPPNTLERADNVICENDAVHAESAVETLTDSPIRPNFLIAVETPEYLGIIAINETRAYAWNGSTWNNITPSGNDMQGPAGDQWVSTSFAGVPIWTHLANYPWAWLDYTTGTDRAVALPWNVDDTWEDKEYHARVIRSYKNFLVALYTEEDNVVHPRRVRWSASVTDLATLPVWDVLPSNDAGSFDIEDVSLGFIDGLQLRDSFIMYGANEAYSLTNIGGDFIMRVDRLPAVRGVLGPNCVVDLGDQHFVVGKSDIYVHNATQVQSVSDERVTREFFDNVDLGRIHLVHAVRDPTRKVVALFYPTSGGSGEVCDECLFWNYNTNTWTKREVDEVTYSIVSTIGEPTEIWGNYPEGGPREPNAIPWETWEDWPGTWGDVTSFGSAKTLISGLSDSTLIDYSPASIVEVRDFTQPYIERSGVPLDDLQQYFHVSTVYPRMTACGECGVPISLQIGMQNQPEDAIRWSPVRVFTPGVDKKFDVRLAGSLLAYRIWSETPGYWRFHGIELEVIPGGRE